MVIKDLVPVEWSNQRVLLSKQVAECYKCAEDRIKDNFHTNKKQYTEGLHYFKITGSDLQNFRVRNPHLQISPMTRTLYLWTATGIFLHCKMINTPQAWELFSKIGETLSVENHSVLEEAIFGKIKPLEPKPDLARVYAIEFDNGFVKIGMSNDVDARKGNIRRKLQFKALQTYCTDFMPRQIAHKIEKTCHKFFHEQLAYRHEYFHISFEEARKIIDSFVKLVAAAPIVSDLKRGGKILKLVDRKFD